MWWIVPAMMGFALLNPSYKAVRLLPDREIASLRAQ
jgi:hypothetical protein